MLVNFRCIYVKGTQGEPYKELIQLLWGQTLSL